MNKTCDQCREEFPAELVNELFAGGAYLHVCGVCALAQLRAVTKDGSVDFSPGSRAKDIYRRCRMIKLMRRVEAGEGRNAAETG